MLLRTHIIAIALASCAAIRFSASLFMHVAYACWNGPTRAFREGTRQPRWQTVFFVEYHTAYLTQLWA
jgi:hypothetical protein